MTNYTELLASLQRLGDQSIDAHIPESWMQGRTTYGGLTAALSLQGALGLVDDIPIRSAQVAFVGPVGGDITIKPTLLRRGKNTAFVSVDVVALDGTSREDHRCQHDEEVAHGNDYPPAASADSARLSSRTTRFPSVSMRPSRRRSVTAKLTVSRVAPMNAAISL